MTGYVYISSNRADRPYVAQLIAYLTENGIPCEQERTIQGGESWAMEIQREVTHSSAFVLVMSSNAERSQWLAQEHLLAQHLGKPIFALLLEGRPFFTLLGETYEDVTDGSMPSQDFVSRLRAAINAHTLPRHRPLLNAEQSPADKSEGGRIFISYSHKDTPYVDQLTAYLTASGLTVWTDHGIDFGTRWVEVIEAQIEACAVFIPVMSENSKAAAWVAREVNLAQALGKEILPLLLSGTQFLSLRDLQHEDVTNGAMPREIFVSTLRRLTRNEP